MVPEEFRDTRNTLERMESVEKQVLLFEREKL
jgi:hypothetical protein